MEVLDRDQLVQNVDGDGELLEEIVNLFFDSSGEILATLREAVGRGDPEAIHRAAHQFKGALANVGAVAATEAALQLETRGRQGTMTGLEDSLRSLETELQRLEPALQELVRAHKV